MCIRLPCSVVGIIRSHPSLRSEDVWVGHQLRSAVLIRIGMEEMRNSNPTQGTRTVTICHTQTLNNTTTDIDGASVWVATCPCEPIVETTALLSLVALERSIFIDSKYQPVFSTCICHRLGCHLAIPTRDNRN